MFIAKRNKMIQSPYDTLYIAVNIDCNSVIFNVSSQ